jgi:hypothetical protein
MEKSVFAQARDLPPEKRLAAELLLGQPIGEDELISVRASKGRLLKPGLTGQALEDAYQQFFQRVDTTAQKAQGVPEREIEEAISEAIEAVRQNRG